MARKHVTEIEETNRPDAADLASRIKKQGKRSEGMFAVNKSPKADAGLYEITHGRVCFGYDDKGEGIYAETGAHVELTEEEAGRMLADGTVKKVA